jgi:2,4-dienoyl-CoA reductase-like NADH-dependent reductase (Old Yellow Enzyme family)
MSAVDLSPLFTPFKLKGLTLPNRFIMPAMQRKWCADGKPLPGPGRLLLSPRHWRRAAGDHRILRGRS